MSAYYGSVGERAIDKLPDSLAALNMLKEKIGRNNVDRVIGTTVAMLNQTQMELERSRREIESLKAQISEWEKIATTDMLTGLKNRRGFDEAFARELDRARREHSTGGVLVVIDLDSFKAINDTFGHQAGDACLKCVAQALMQEIRESDVAARLGGDEFVMLLTDTSPELLLTRVQNIAWKLNHLSLMWDGTEIAVNGSVGMRPYRKGDTADDVFADADTNMYAAKSRSKRKV